MLPSFAALAVFLVLAGPFGEATVEGTPSGDRLQVEFEIEIAGSPAAVVVHAVDPGQSQETLSLARRSDGHWTGVADLETMNYVVVFEVLYADGGGDTSDPATLLSLGLDPELIGLGDVVVVEDGDVPLTARTRRWGWGAVALASVALALLAVWALGGRDRADPVEDDRPPSDGPAPNARRRRSGRHRKQG